MKPSTYSLNDPITAIATGLVPAALGIVRCSGKNTIKLVSNIFSKPKTLLQAAGNTLIHGWILNEKQEKIDEVVLSVYRAPKSFTGEDAVEIIGHGGIATILAIYRQLIKTGFRVAERGEFTFRAFANGKTNLVEAEAIREIVDAHTDKARSKAVERLSGNLTKKISDIASFIVQVLAAISVVIEYPEDEETTKGAYDANLVEQAQIQLKQLATSWASEKIYQDGAKLVLAGKTNAGKSSLFNALLKEDRAIVSETHGTTRDWLEARADFLGIPITLYDTAGLRETSDIIEAEGVQRSHSLADTADCIAYVVDACLGFTKEDFDFIKTNLNQKNIPLIIVWNKADKEKALPLPKKTKGVLACIKTSAKTQIGIQDFVQLTVDILTSNTPQSRETGLGTERQKQAIEQALEYLNHAQKAVEQGFPMDAVSQDLEDALYVLGEITGEHTSDDILDAVFSEFCVGK